VHNLQDSQLSKLAYLYISKGTEPCGDPKAYGNITFKKYQTLEQACSTQLIWKKQKYRKGERCDRNIHPGKIPTDNARYT
jgi:hypothetical protein